MNDLVSACTVCKTGESLYVDPTADERNNGNALATLAYQPRLHRIVHVRVGLALAV